MLRRPGAYCKQVHDDSIIFYYRSCMGSGEDGEIFRFSEICVLSNVAIELVVHVVQRAIVNG